MKKLLLFIVAAVVFTSCATYQKVSLGPATRIYEVAGDSKAELYVKSIEWLIDSFKDAKSVIQFKDKEEGIIVGKYLMCSTKIGSGSGAYYEDLYAKIKINTKDNATRLIIEPLGEWNYDSGSLTVRNYSKNNAIDEINGLIESYEKMLDKEDAEW